MGHRAYLSGIGLSGRCVGGEAGGAGRMNSVPGIFHAIDNMASLCNYIATMEPSQ